MMFVMDGFTLAPRENATYSQIRISHYNIHENKCHQETEIFANNSNIQDNI